MYIERDTLRMWFREGREDAVRAARALAYSLPDKEGPGDRAKQDKARARLWECLNGLKCVNRVSTHFGLTEALRRILDLWDWKTEDWREGRLEDVRQGCYALMDGYDREDGWG